MNFFRLSILLLAFSFFSCGDIIQDFSCFHFDQRQCQTDEYGPDIAAADPSEWTGIIKEYLESKSIVVNEVLVNFQYYEAVCEACDICPEVHRFYVKISVLDVAKIVELDLMNMKEDLCNDFF